MQSEKGFILPIVLLVSLLLVITLTSILDSTYQEASLVNREDEELKAIYIAEGGLRAGFAAYRGNPAFRGNFTGILDADSFRGEYKVKIIEDGQKVIIISTGKLAEGQVEKVLSADISAQSNQRLKFVEIQ